MEDKGTLGFSLHCGLDKLPMDPQGVWDWGDAVPTLAQVAGPYRDKSWVAGVQATRFTFVLPHV